MKARDLGVESRFGEDGEKLIHSAEQFARHEPMKAVGGAFVAGLMLTVLPVGSIFVVLVRLAIVLLRPALLVLGAVKLYEEMAHRKH